MSKLHSFADNTTLIQQLSERIATVLQEDIQQSGHALMAVSGGNSPKALFAYLRNQTIDWNKVTIVLVDERCVCVEHVDSNERMVRENLLQGPAAQAHFIGWTSDTDNLLEAASYANSLFKQLSLPFSVVILGMGADGHTASWFSDAPEYYSLVDPSQEPAVCATKPSTAPHQRLTLNYSAVIQTRFMALQINGTQKKHTLERAFAKKTANGLPIAHLLAEDIPLEIYWSEI